MAWGLKDHKWWQSQGQSLWLQTSNQMENHIRERQMPALGAVQDMAIFKTRQGNDVAQHREQIGLLSSVILTNFINSEVTIRTSNLCVLKKITGYWYSLVVISEHVQNPRLAFLACACGSTCTPHRHTHAHMRAHNRVVLGGCSL